MTPARLAALHAQCFTAPRPWTAAEFAALLGQPGLFLLTEAEGFALGRVVADEAELLTLAVAPEARRRGSGRRLLAAFAAEALARGAREVFLEVAEDNAAARALYARTGWSEAGRRRAYLTGPDGRPVDALILRRALPEPSGRSN